MLLPASHLYSRWLKSALGAGAIPEESRATCADCAMCKPDSGFTPDAENEELRFVSQGCCIFHPHLPNFLVGQALAQIPERRPRPRTRKPQPPHGERTAQALAVIRSRIRDRAECTPFGILPPRSMDQVQTDPVRYNNVFGSDESLRCPLHHAGTDGGSCAIWPQRNAVCSTWFCKFERGVFSKWVWDAVKALLLGVETSLSSWCVQQLFRDAESIALLFDVGGAPRHDVLRQLSAGLEDDGRIPDRAARRLWGDWYGQEEEFFRACAQRVARLGWADVRRIGGERIDVLERLTGRALSRLARSDIPARLRHSGMPGPLFQIRPGGDGSAAVHAFEVNFDVQRFETALLERLPAFDGHATVAKVRAGLKKSGVSLGDETLRRLVDYGLLVSAPSSPPEPGERRPVEPEDRLRVIQGEQLFRQFSSEVDFDARGAAIVRLICGFESVEFDEAGLLEFGRQLARRRWGFTASECPLWSTGPDPLAWERVAPVLDALVAEGVLERVAPGPPRRRGKAVAPRRRSAAGH